MKTYKISIPKPCTENWDRMTQTDKGKHCASCNKVVIDFSKMKDQEIIDVMLKHHGKKVCGNFFNTQIEKPIRYIIPQKHIKWPAIAAMLVAGIFHLMPLTGSAQTNTNVTLHSSSLSIERNNETPKETKTEPGKDSLITYTIKIIAKEGKTPIVDASVTIDQIGTFTSDKNGKITFSIAEGKIPELVQVQITASGYNYQSMQIQKNKILQSKKIEVLMTVREEYMLRGDISIEETR